MGFREIITRSSREDMWITSGPDTLDILARSVSQGRGAGILSAPGIGSGVILHTLLAAFGLSAVLAASAFAFTAVKTAGGYYQIFSGSRRFGGRGRVLPDLLGIQALRRPLAPPEPLATAPASRWLVLRQGFMAHALNPEVAMFFLAFLPQFVDPGAGLGPVPFLVLGAAFVGGGTAWCVLVAVFTAALSGSVRRNRWMVGWLGRVAGCVYIGLGVHLLRHLP